MLELEWSQTMLYERQSRWHDARLPPTPPLLHVSPKRGETESGLQCMPQASVAREH